MVDANYKFIYVDTGAAGRAGDAGVFSDSTLKKALTTNSLDLLEASALPGISTKISHHVVGDGLPFKYAIDEAVPLSQFGQRETYI